MWLDVAVVFAIVAVGVVIAAATNDPGPDATPVGSGYVAEPVEYPVRIPGCATVEPPEEERAYAYEVAVGELVYDDPANTWLDAPKARAMSDSLRRALPGGVVTSDASAGGSISGDPFEFEPIPRIDPALDIDPGTTADGVVARNGGEGVVAVNVARAEPGPVECRADLVDSREVHSDGTVVDVQETWSEYDGVRTTTRVVRVYWPDGTHVTASASNQDAQLRTTETVPLSIDELTVLALLPELRWTAG